MHIRKHNKRPSPGRSALALRHRRRGSQAQKPRVQGNPRDRQFSSPYEAHSHWHTCPEQHHRAVDTPKLHRAERLQSRRGELRELYLSVLRPRELSELSRSFKSRDFAVSAAESEGRGV